jgi:DNA polymerase-3 subunit alpha
MVRNVGTHAAGVIIADRPLKELVPLTTQDGILTTQFPKDPVEDLGLLKMDFLGLKTLTVIAAAEKHIREKNGFSDFRVADVSLEDEKTFELLNEARTIGVFQLESDGMRRLCRQMTITNVDEIIALIALYRPGPMDWIPDYIKGKEDPSTIKFPHPLLEEVCKETYGVMVYQEQVMEAARRVAGYSLGGADILRRAMGKKKPEEMAKQREIFVKGAKETNNIAEKKANEIFSILEKFAGYGFNKSHSAAYGIISYQTGYLKANFPVHFMAGVLSCELGNSDKLSHFIGECTEMGISVLGPDLNESGENFTPVEGGDAQADSIRFGLAAVKGVGDAPSAVIVGERKNGPYLSFSDLVERVDGKAVNKRVLENLIKAGGFDSVENSRASLLADLDRAMGEAQLRRKDREAGQVNLFDMMGEDDSGGNSAENGGFSPVSDRPEVEPMDELEKLRYEKELLGFFLSGHPVDTLGGLGALLDDITAEEIENLEGRRSFRLCGVLGEIERRYTKKDAKPWARFTLMAKEKDFSIPMFTEACEQYGLHLEDGRIVVVEGVASHKDGETRLSVTNLKPIEAAIASVTEEVTWLLDPDDPECEQFTLDMFSLGDRGEGSTLIRLAYARSGEDDGLVVETDSRFLMRFSSKVFKEWRNKKPVRGARVLIRTPEPPPERKFGKKKF